MAQFTFNLCIVCLFMIILHSVLEDLLNENNSSRYGVHVFPPKKPRGKGVHIQSNLRSKDFEDIDSFVRWIEPSDVKENPWTKSDKENLWNYVS